MADSPVFDHACSELQRFTDLDRLEARGTLRIVLKAAGLEVASVDVAQMRIVVERLMPAELEKRGVRDTRTVCESVIGSLESVAFEVAVDRAGAAAEAIARFGS